MERRIDVSWLYYLNTIAFILPSRTGCCHCNDAPPLSTASISASVKGFRAHNLDGISQKSSYTFSVCSSPKELFGDGGDDFEADEEDDEFHFFKKSWKASFVSFGAAG